MRFLCLGYYDAATFDALSSSELEALGKRCRPHDEALRRTGQVVLTASLEHRRAVVLRARDRKVQITDGPFAETKEQIGSAFVVEAPDLDAAVRVASLHPAARLGEELGWAIEIRPIAMFLE